MIKKLLFAIPLLITILATDKSFGFKKEVLTESIRSLELKSTVSYAILENRFLAIVDMDSTRPDSNISEIRMNINKKDGSFKSLAITPFPKGMTRINTPLKKLIRLGLSGVVFSPKDFNSKPKLSDLLKTLKERILKLQCSQRYIRHTKSQEKQPSTTLLTLHFPTLYLLVKTLAQEQPAKKDQYERIMYLQKAKSKALENKLKISIRPVQKVIHAQKLFFYFL